MQFNYKTKEYLKQNEAVLIKSEYKICQINFHNLTAFVNKVDTYRKRNGKICKVEHHYGKWIPFTKDLIRYGKSIKKGETNDIFVGDREPITYEVKNKFLPKESQQQIINLYIKENDKRI